MCCMLDHFKSTVTRSEIAQQSYVIFKSRWMQLIQIKEKNGCALQQREIPIVELQDDEIKTENQGLRTNSTQTMPLTNFRRGFDEIQHEWGF